ncbi:MAG: hypothetical protein JWN17_2467 [Frankiales bacterium]|nr:hypothetical protein [Frankiales bacterium]
MTPRRDPAAPGLALFAALAAAGLLAIGIGWRVAARTLFVPFQVPALVSGGLGGLALVMLGAGLFSVQVARREAAAEQAAFDGLLDEAAGLVADVRGDRR